MAITFGATAQSGVFTGTTFTPSRPVAPSGGNPASGDVIWCFVGTGDQSPGLPAGTNGWTLQNSGAAGPSFDFGAGPDVYIYTILATGSEGTTLSSPTTLDTSGANNAYLCLCTRGNDTTTLLSGTPQHEESNSNGATSAVPSFTPGAATDMIVCFANANGNNLTNASTVSIDNSFTDYSAQFNTTTTNKRVIGVFARQATSTAAIGTTTVTWSQSAAGHNATIFGMKAGSLLSQDVGMIPLN